MFRKILISNRGEIACRIIRTCRKMGICSVAVFSDADQNSLHVKLADESIHIGESPSSKSYLVIKNLLFAAQKSGAEAIHPGYGFLSESAEFAKQCRQKGIVFIGPSEEVINKMGSKDQAKLVMKTAGISVLPGYSGNLQDPDILIKEAEKIGFPLMIKPVLGGGGRGMRLVREKKEFLDNLESAKSEALNAFGDDRVLLESCINVPRHIEFQILGDQHGNVIHLFERDCSLQRRYQKVVEETPSPFLDEKLRIKMSLVAIKAAKVLQYSGAGTVEFILGEDRKFFFIEMNTRLQVEHAITEMITGLDLVELQIKVALGEKLSINQDEICKTGNAIEIRIYAENPEDNFLPSIGTLHCLSLNEENNLQKSEKVFKNKKSELTIRIDTGLEEGAAISRYYDPLIAKMIVHANSRLKAIESMESALSRSGVLGVETNLSFLQNILNHPDFKSGEIDTLFIDKNINKLNSRTPDPPDWVCWGAAIYFLKKETIISQNNSKNSVERYSPWGNMGNWRSGAKEPHKFILSDKHGVKSEIKFYQENNIFRVLKGEKIIPINVNSNEKFLTLKWNEGELEEKEENLLVIHHESEILTVYKEGRTIFSVLDILDYKNADEVSDSRIISPMPGTIVRLFVKAGEKVITCQKLLVIESMKMEHTVYSPSVGIVKKICFKSGDIVEKGLELIEISYLDK